MEIFSTTRIRFAELYQDSINFFNQTYKNVGQYFTMASPMGQLLQVILNYGRMILYYVEDSITELNVKTATRPQSIKGLATLTGHNPSRAISARGTIKLSYNGQKLPIYGNIVSIPNYTQLLNNQNGLIYTINLPGEEVIINLTSQTNFVNVNVIQGTLEYQQATGTGDPLQSFNFQSKKGASIDNFYVNVYVDGVKWPTYDSILDLTFNLQGCLVRTGQSGGIDIFFGNSFNGQVPRLGSVIMVEYLITDGDQGNITDMTDTVSTWKFLTNGYSLNSQPIDLNTILNVSIVNDIIFGTIEEPLYLTRLLAPMVSRSFVLANPNNYIYFLRKLNIFTIIDAIPGFQTFEDQNTIALYNQAMTNYQVINNQYSQSISTYGAASIHAKSIKTQLDSAQKQIKYYQSLINSQQRSDNTIYLFLVPDITKRIPSGTDYYTCSIDAFSLSENEKTAILDLIEESGQRVTTVDNVILSPKYPRFVINMSLILYEDAAFNNVSETIISQTASYFTQTTRRDRLPVSDIISIVEAIDGIDSVTVWFDADMNNLQIYGDSYGIDDYGDILMTRNIKDAFGNNIQVNDIYVLIRGGFSNQNGVFYEDAIDQNNLSTINIQVRGYTQRDINSENNQVIITNLNI